MIVWLAAAALAARGAAAAPRAVVQVAIVREALSAVITPEGEAEVVAPGRAPSALQWNGRLPLKPAERGVRLATLSLPSETRLVLPKGGDFKVGGNRYRGQLILRLDPGHTVTVVEEIALEDYLEGVLPHEMDADWPLEALKAQAVVARTFAYVNMGKYRKQGFDLTADTDSQVYRGLTDVNENVRAAVRQTRGEVLGWDGKIMRVYYHSCCGGMTQNAARAWGGELSDPPPPLRGVKDPWCRTSPHMHWTAYFTWTDLMAAIQERQSLPGPLSALKIGRRDVAGYVSALTGRAGSENVEIKTSELRSALGAGELKSTRILKIRIRKHGVEFEGAGSGHGVGLCQWGARRQAEAGRTYEQILRFYFPGSELSEVET